MDGSKKSRLARPWGNAEIAKPLAERHPVMQWYESYCHYQRKHVLRPGEVFEAEVTGVVGCYIGLAYSLYLLNHNVELQTRLLKRLKDPSNFQGAYYELIVANTLLRAGFQLALEDEDDRDSKHCEFSAVSKRTGKKYRVEAKMRSVRGLLGKTEKDGTPDTNPISHLNKHLTAALAKPAEDARLIFIDLNCEERLDTPGKPVWADTTTYALEKYEQRHPDANAYVIVTNLPFHRMLDERVPLAALPFGLNMKDFNRPGHYRLSVAWKQKQKHIDAFNICEAIESLTKFPATFDGTLPSEAFGRDNHRIVIGETYFFEDDQGGGTVGTVTTASVLESEKQVWFGISTPDGRHLLHQRPMTDAALKDYKDHPDTYFGRYQRAGRRAKSIYEMFEFFMESHTDRTRDFLLAELKKAPEPGGFDHMTDDELRALYCERLCGALQRHQHKSAPAEQPQSAPAK